MNIFGNIIKDAIKKVINEGISDIVYHFTSIAVGYNICLTDKIVFTPTIGSQAESDLNGKAPYFLSTTRQRNSKFGYSVKFSQNSVRIALDGRKLRENLSGKSVDYWYSPHDGTNSKQSYYKKGGFSFKTAQQHISNESEDRLLSRKQVLENAHKYILNVDVLLNSNLTDDEKKAFIDKFLSTPLSGVVRIFDTIEDFNSLDGRNTLNNEFNFTPSEEAIDWANRRLTLVDGFFSRDENNKYLEIVGDFLYVIFYENRKLMQDKDKCQNEITKLLKRYGLDDLIPNIPSYYDEMIRRSRNGCGTRDFDVAIANVNALRKNPNEITVKLTKMIVDYCRSIGAYSIKDLVNIKWELNQKAAKETPKVKCMKFYSCSNNQIKSCEAIVLNARNTPFYNVIERIAFGDKSTADYNIEDAIRGIANDFEEENYEHKSKNIESFKKYLYHIFKYGSVSDVISAISNSSDLMELFKYHFWIYPNIEYVEVDDLVDDALKYEDENYQLIVDFPIDWNRDKIKEELEEKYVS